VVQLHRVNQFLNSVVQILAKPHERHQRSYFVKLFITQNSPKHAKFNFCPQESIWFVCLFVAGTLTLKTVLQNTLEHSIFRPKM